MCGINFYFFKIGRKDIDCRRITWMMFEDSHAKCFIIRSSKYYKLYKTIYLALIRRIVKELGPELYESTSYTFIHFHRLSIDLDIIYNIRIGFGISLENFCQMVYMQRRFYAIFRYLGFLKFEHRVLRILLYDLIE